jgi:hypothetical protein
MCLEINRNGAMPFFLRALSAPGVATRLPKGNGVALLAVGWFIENPLMMSRDDKH